MKQQLPDWPRRQPAEIPGVAQLKTRGGIALVLVLGILVLLSALVISFFSSVTTELASSRNYANEATAKQLADSTVQLVLAQISEASSGLSDTDDPDSPKVAWASQPGMIRTYGEDGNPGRFYKLYSSSLMTVDGAAFSTAAEVPPSDWDSKSNAGLFTDLNSPVASGNVLNFPIIDPRAKTAQAGTSVEGFDYRTDINGIVLPAGDPDDQRLPMPTRWLYVLQDGKIATPAGSNGGIVTFDSAEPSRVPSAQNPIVGRIAFWTDDESCKINLNTASEGTFWERPWANTTREQKFSTSIPAQNEFQRFPGHPAMTCLSPVFGPLLGTLPLNDYYNLVPRIAVGGTSGGTVDNLDASFTQITPDADRLYASVDEMLYAPAMASETARAGNPSVTNNLLETTKFFLTTHSRAPELNLFGKPRIALWPIQKRTDERNAKDRLIAFCSEIGGNPFYFQRFSRYTPAASPFVLGGGAPASSSQSTSLDWDGVDRNRTLYSYIDQLTSQNIPGFGGTFSAKYQDTKKQILTEMFDMIRSGVNAYSTALSPNYNYAPALGDPGEGQIIPLQLSNGTQGFGRYATVVGATIVFFRGNEAFYTTTGNTTPPTVVSTSNPHEVAITPAPAVQAVILLTPFTPAPGLPTWSPNLQYVITGLENFRINGTSMGFQSKLVNAVTSRVGFSGGGNATSFLGLRASFRYADDIGKGLLGKDTTKTLGFDDPVRKYPFWSGTPGVTVNAPTFDFQGGTITISIYSAADAALAIPIQTIQMNFPDAAGLPVPTTRPALATTPAGSRPQDFTYYKRFFEASTNSFNSAKDARYKFMESYPIPTPTPNTYQTYFGTIPSLGQFSDGTPVTYRVHDVVRGVEADPTGPARGDLRVYAALNEVPASYFRPTPRYTDSAVLFSHSLRDEGILTGNGQFGYDASRGGVDPHYDNFPDGGANPNGLPIIQSNSGFLVQQQYLGAYGGSAATGTVGQKEYRAAASPAVPRGLTAALNNDGAPGDWDNMTGLMSDGPFINKPDEGNSATVSKLSGVSYFNKTISGGYFSFGLDRFGEGGDYRAETGQTFSPNRQIASAVMFGSLPTGIDPASPSGARPWQTLLFCANPAAGTNHPGRGTPQSGPPYTTPPDHLMLDLFTMPIVEPYAISEPFSTAGKVNMNYQIMPFTYVTRNTGVRAVLKSAKLMAIPSNASTRTNVNSYKDGSSTGYPFELRYDINPSEQGGTLQGFENRFQAGEIFRSASEICEIYLVPKKMAGVTNYPSGTSEPTYDTVASWWDTNGPANTGFRITGDNVREAPYNSIYPRLTTKSNTYTIHLRVQSLKKAPGTRADQWVEGRDQVSGEFRGSSLVERYVDAADPNLPDFAQPSAPNADQYYRMRIVSSKKFEP